MYVIFQARPDQCSFYPMPNLTDDSFYPRRKLSNLATVDYSMKETKGCSVYELL